MKIVLGAALLAALWTGNLAAQATKPSTPKKATAGVAKPAAQKPAVAKPPAAMAPAERLVQIATPYGTMVAKLYNATPQHRDNFIKLIQQGFYDSLLFHRVINQFMVQGGDPNSRNAPPDAMLGMGSAPGSRIPAEFNPAFFHKKGALAAARDNNPEKASSNCQFYIVQGKPAPAGQLSQEATATYSPTQKEIYERIGGTPFLDQNYTVFGEVISGLDVIDKLASVPTGPNNRPATNLPMTLKMLN